MFYSKNRQEFLPYEFDLKTTEDHAPLMVPGDAFLLELAAFLWDQGLENVLGLCRRSSTGDRWLESVSTDGKGTLATRISREITAQDGVLTEWEFVVDENGAHIKATRACQDTESGGHVRK